MNGAELIIGQEATYRDHNYAPEIYGYIYKITNKINGKIYIGQTVKDITKRWSQHLHCCRNKKPHAPALYNAMLKYGIENFTIDIVCIGVSKEDLNQKECFWITTLATIAPSGYNIANGGQDNSHLKGRKAPNEVKQKMSKSHKRRYEQNPELRNKISQFFKNLIRTDLHKAKIGAMHKGKPLSEEVRKKISNALMGKAQTPAQIAAAISGVKAMRDRYYADLARGTRRILVTDKNDNIVGEFLDNTQCAKALGIVSGPTRIRDYLSGKLKSRKYNFAIIEKDSKVVDLLEPYDK